MDDFQSNIDLISQKFHFLPGDPAQVPIAISTVNIAYAKRMMLQTSRSLKVV